MNFESLVGRINQVQDVLQAQAAHAVNLVACGYTGASILYIHSWVLKLEFIFRITV